LEASLAGAAGVLTSGLQKIFAAASQARGSMFQLGGDLLVNRIRFGAMRLTGEGIWGLAARSREREESFAACGRAGRQFHRHGGVPSDVGCASKAKECVKSSKFVS